MKRSFKPGIPLLGVLVLCACHRDSGPPQAEPPIDSRKPGDQLLSLVEDYWSATAAGAPWYAWGAADLESGAPAGERIAPQALADSMALERRSLAQALAIPRMQLDPESKLTYDIFCEERALALQGFTYPVELLPVNPYDGLVQRYADVAPQAERLGLANEDDYESWRARSRKFVEWVDQAIGNMREGMRRGYTLPRVIVEETLPELATLGEDGADNPFLKAIAAVPASDHPERARLARLMALELTGNVLPAYRRLHDFMQRDYLPRARSSVAVSALPLGDAWYSFLVKRSTGGGSSAAVLHALGRAELDRLHQRVQALLDSAAFSGDARAYLASLTVEPRESANGWADVERTYTAFKSEVDAAVPPLFAALPRGQFAVSAVPGYRAPVAPTLAYRPRSPNGLVGAELEVNASEPHPAAYWMAPYLQNTVPGHHLQLELQRERSDLPRFRRFGANAAFVAGWGLYAATLGEDLHLDHDLTARFGTLMTQMNCAADLVVDTGLHAEGWTRQQALDFTKAQLPVDDVEARRLVDRAIALPGEALACTVGYLEIQALRTLAQQTLGSRFDLRAFHGAVLEEGALPLDLLDQRVRAWIKTTAEAPPPAAAGDAGASATPTPAL